jgi:hypothetical protein
MQTQFICLDVFLVPDPIALIQQVETQLSQTGQPLRWAITEVNGDRASIEAVITLSDRP